MKRVLHVLTGCTAVGKTELALRWAEARGAEIVSCDSLLFYRGMDLGTAKPTVAERARVPHHLIDICGVGDRMDVARYVNWRRIGGGRDQPARGRPVLVTGGSGFYLKAFPFPVADEVTVPLRCGPGAVADGRRLLAECGRLNPAGLGSLDVANPAPREPGAGTVPGLGPHAGRSWRLILRARNRGLRTGTSGGDPARSGRRRN
jgi:tRNA dimethylallyltransferase